MYPRICQWERCFFSNTEKRVSCQNKSGFHTSAHAVQQKKKKNALFPSATPRQLQPCSAGHLRFPRRGAVLLRKMTNTSTLEVGSFYRGEVGVGGGNRKGGHHRFGFPKYSIIPPWHPVNDSTARTVEPFPVRLRGWMRAPLARLRVNFSRLHFK